MHSFENENNESIVSIENYFQCKFTVEHFVIWNSFQLNEFNYTCTCLSLIDSKQNLFRIRKKSAILNKNTNNFIYSFMISKHQSISNVMYLTYLSTLIKSDIAKMEERNYMLNGISNKYKVALKKLHWLNFQMNQPKEWIWQTEGMKNAYKKKVKWK